MTFYSYRPCNRAVRLFIWGLNFLMSIFLFFNATNKIKSVSCLPELQDKFERTNPLFVLYILIAPMDLMKTSPRRNVNISTQNHFTELSIWERNLLIQESDQTTISARKLIPLLRRKTMKKIWGVVKFKFLTSRQNLSFLKKEDHGLDRSPFHWRFY